MNTRYTDMYSSYLQKASENDAIRRFKFALEQSAPKGYQLWSDFEMALAEYAKNFKNEGELIDSIRSFKAHMRRCLLSEQQIFMKYVDDKNGAIACAREMNRSIHNFHRGQIPNVVHSIEQLGDLTKANYRFITFNYTTVLDSILQYYARYLKISPGYIPIHIHGRLDGDIVLGVDSILQFGKLPYDFSLRGERSAIKPIFNLNYDELRIKEAEDAIKESDVICIYGMSLGKSDATWVTKIYNWIINDQNHHLICYNYSDKTFEPWQRDEMMEEEDIQREQLLQKICGLERLEGIEKQVHIPVGYDIFNFKEVIDKEAVPRPSPLPSIKESYYR